MKETIKFLGVIAFVALIAFTIAACTDGKSDLVGKWYGSKKAADEGGSDGLAYEFTSNGNLKILGMSLLSYKVSANTITTKLLGFTTGTANYNISGTELTISNGDPTTGLINGTYYKGKTGTKNDKDIANDEGDEDSPLGFLSILFGKGKNKDIANDEDDGDNPIGGLLNILFGKGKNNDVTINDNEKGDEVSGAFSDGTLQQRLLDLLLGKGDPNVSNDSEPEDISNTAIVSLIKDLFSGGGINIDDLIIGGGTDKSSTADGNTVPENTAQTNSGINSVNLSINGVWKSTNNNNVISIYDNKAVATEIVEAN